MCVRFVHTDRSLSSWTPASSQHHAQHSAQKQAGIQRASFSFSLFLFLNCRGCVRLCVGGWRENCPVGGWSSCLCFSIVSGDPALLTTAPPGCRSGWVRHRRALPALSVTGGRAFTVFLRCVGRSCCFLFPPKTQISFCHLNKTALCLFFFIVGLFASLQNIHELQKKSLFFPFSFKETKSRWGVNDFDAFSDLSI